MPELPEVETVKRELTKTLVGKVLSRPIVNYEKMIKTPLAEYLDGVSHQRITDITRRGKFLILHLSNAHKLVFHLRMEGKMYVVDKEKHSENHLSMFFPFENDETGLAFYDVRKFGVTFYLKEEEEGPLSTLGPEPFDIKDANYLLLAYQKKKKCIKELLMDQTIMSGLGNIYANEVCYACEISPFMNSSKLTLEQAERILKESKRILNLAIENNGSTIRSYHATQDLAGSFQDFIKAYGNEGKVCPTCKTYKIEKKFLAGRGTCYCPHCQHTGISIGITGKIASGKSLASSYFEEYGFVRFSCDEEVHRMYKEKKFLEELRKNFPEIFNKKLSKAKITKLLQTNPAFKKKYQSYIYKEVRKRANDFMIKHDGENKIVEVPLLFEAHMEHDFTYLVGTETTRQVEHLKERGEDSKRQAFNKLNSYDKHRYQLDYILHTDGTKEELKQKVFELADKLLTK